MNGLNSTVFLLALLGICAGGVAWMVARWVDPVLSQPRYTVWVWRAARMAALVPAAGLLAALLASFVPPQIAERAPDVTLFAAPMFQIPLEAVQPVMAAAQDAVETAALPAGLFLLAAYGLGLLAALSRAAGRRIALSTLLRQSREAPEPLQALAAQWRRRLKLRPDQGGVRMVDAALSPFVSGLKPVILMPQGLSDGPDAEMALAHELMHVRRGDELDRLVGEALTIVFWFNPFSVLIERRLAGARELACDADMLDHLGGAARRDYARALTRAAPLAGDARLQCAFLTDAKELRLRRVKAILSYTPARRGARATAGLAGLAVLLAASPAAASAWWASTESRAGAALAVSVQAAEPQALSSEIGAIVQRLVEANAGEDFEASLALSNEALARLDLSAYERAVVLQLRAVARYSGDDYAGAIADLEAVIATGAMIHEVNAGMRVQIGQLYIAEGQLERGVASLEAGLAAGADATQHLSRLMAQAYAQVGRAEDARPFAERYYSRLQAPTSGDAALMVFIFQELGRIQDALPFYERYFDALENPQRRDLLTLVNLYNAANRSEDAQRIWDAYDMAEFAREAQREEDG